MAQRVGDDAVHDDAVDQSAQPVVRTDEPLHLGLVTAVANLRELGFYAADIVLQTVGRRLGVSDSVIGYGRLADWTCPID